MLMEAIVGKLLSNCTVMEVFSLQELWKFASLSKNVVSFYSEVSFVCMLVSDVSYV